MTTDGNILQYRDKVKGLIERVIAMGIVTINGEEQRSARKTHEIRKPFELREKDPNAQQKREIRLRLYASRAERGVELFEGMPFKGVA